MTDVDVTHRPPLIILANDQEWSARSLESILGPSGYAVVRAHTMRQAEELARSVRPDLVIVDERLPDGRGTQLCRTLRDDPLVGSHVPLLLLSGDAGDREATLAGYEAGAWDYVREPVDAEALLLRIATFIRAKREVDRVHADSLVDEATGLYNARGIARRVRELGAEAYRLRAPLACVALAPAPLGGTLEGEAATKASDAGLRRLGELLRLEGRASDAVGRVGRSEFAVVAPGTDEAGARQLIARLRERAAALVAEEVAGDAAHGLDVEVRHLRAGYSAVADYAESPLNAEEMLVRALVAVRSIPPTAGDVVSVPADLSLRQAR